MKVSVVQDFNDLIYLVYDNKIKLLSKNFFKLMN